MLTKIAPISEIIEERERNKGRERKKGREREKGKREREGTKNESQAVSNLKEKTSLFFFLLLTRFKSSSLVILS